MSRFEEDRRRFCFKSSSAAVTLSVRGTQSTRGVNRILSPQIYCQTCPNRISIVCHATSTPVFQCGRNIGRTKAGGVDEVVVKGLFEDFW
ncbi:hypothetical protein AGABI2DRAFT_194046 [Agaricus bisporus var. bisporus H97]|uniref:hypothetical protein n=1 Tax=Agaricus bisporus var. bisporus (strain H97 / ATCC MYA-4626 / FGSC 10389) TaxID=936046 RepID=UPI00029F7A34|nr:hypothetical protein AGABI2DRAFT_194046 [Agaricus bisporus var. bisporus H97]EKV46183.1 hypothetical protein AGABI2DRAFT_194046 [Agaricus bisporus var. bisporus H97]